MRALSLSILSLGLMLGGCASRPPVAEPLPAADPRDRAAILAMAGDYAVSFQFQETVILKSGYQRQPDRQTPALERVIVLLETPETVVLQHLLLSEDGRRVIKHWRQDWHYNARERLEFTEDQTWRLRPLDPARHAGAWTQCVYEVSDAPRYCGTGRWNHRYGVATWTSDRSWRPLPRREYTVRSDYNALNVENRHTVTAEGWTHEQDNTKTLRDGSRTDHTLVREFGFNDYRRVSDRDFSAADRYWQATSPFWAGVRAEWSRRIAAQGGIQLRTTVDGMALIAPLFAMAAAVEAGTPPEPTAVVALFDTWTAPPPSLAAR